MPLDQQQINALQVPLKKLLKNDHHIVDGIAECLQSLRSYISKGDSDDDVVNLLMQRGTGGWNSGHVIAGYRMFPKVVLEYVELLKDLIPRQSAQVVELLRQKNRDGSHAGHVIAYFHTDPLVAPYVLGAYLSLLKELMSTQFDEVVNLLQQRNGSGWNIGHSIAFFQRDPQVLGAYLSLLKELMTHGQQQAVITILQQQTKKNGWNIGHYLACHQTDPEALGAYLALLEDVNTRGQAQAVIMVLQQQNENGCNIGHYITRFQTNPGVVKDYLALIEQTHGDKVLTLLRQSNNTGWKIGHYIDHFQKSAMNDYLKILNTFVSKAPEEVFFLLTTTLLGMAFSQTKSKAAEVDRGRIPTDAENERLYNTIFLEAFLAIFTPEKKGAIAHQYIQHSAKVTELLLALPSDEPKTLVLLRRCMDQSDPLGQYCHTSTGTGIRAAYRGTTTMAEKILAKINQIAPPEALRPAGGLSQSYASTSAVPLTVRKISTAIVVPVDEELCKL